MNYTFYELLWLFIIYSFNGWLLETIAAAIKQKRFVNRGLVNSPFCLLYGFSAVFITIFGGELNGIWLFWGTMLMATVFEWIAGHLIEALYHDRWWNYSGKLGNIDGYICFSTSVLWGILGYITMRWGNQFYISLFHYIPKLPGQIILWLLFGLLLLDIAASLAVASGRSRHLDQWKALDNWFGTLAAHLGAPIYKRIVRRLDLAYPRTASIPSAHKKSTIFAEGCSFDKILWLFTIGSFLGDITETFFCRISAGIWMSRSSVVWGPFSIVWGLGIVAFTVLLYKYRNHSDIFLFLAGTFLGGAYENW